MLAALLTLFSCAILAGPLGTAFNYAGSLNDGGLPARGLYDLRFSLYSDEAGGRQVGPILTNAATPVTNGAFAVTLDFGDGAFLGETRWLEVSVRSNGTAVGFTVLSPRQPMSPRPYALYAPLAGTALAASNLLTALPGTQLAGAYANALSFTNPANVFAGNGAGLTKVNAGALDGLAASAFWQLGGNMIGVSETPILGTHNDAPLDLLVKDQRALRLQPNGTSPSLIGGHAVNFAASSAYGAVIGGGGRSSESNAVYAPQAVIAGGEHNTVQASLSAIGGGTHNTIQTNTSSAIIAGGYYNEIGKDSRESAIVGGSMNGIETNSPHSFIGGGARNRINANAEHSVIGGGEGNDILDGAAYATIPGGRENSISGNHSFAAGYGARASHASTFVWADEGRLPFGSSSSNQFLIRATGNVGINKNNPATTLDVAGAVTATNFLGSGASLTNLNAGALASGSVPDPRLSTNVALRNADQTFTGTVNFSPASGPPFTVGSSAKVPMLNADTLDGHDSSFFWGTLGNSATLPGFHFIGTTDDHPLEFKVNGLRALRIEPSTNGAPNVIGGAPVNFVAAGVVGATIAGGGATNYNGAARTQTILAAFGAIGGGAGNQIAAASGHSTIGGGNDNTAAGLAATVSGGANNTAGASDTDYATVGGGSGNTALGFAATVGGGNANRATSGSATVGGGNGNTAGAGAATVGGGLWNVVAGFAATVGGGHTNRATSDSATVGGGNNNLAGAGAATVGGGSSNLAAGFAATVGGGHTNRANGSYATVGGGRWNIADGEFADVGGGYLNFAVGDYATVPGGYHNRATGAGSFAAGRQAHCDHDGTFLWNDGSWNAFTTGSNRFEVSASGGVFFYSGATCVLSLSNKTAPAYFAGEVSCASLTSRGGAAFAEEVSCATLTIRGGADLAEPFAMSDAGIGPGAVVVIDEKSPGQLRLSTRASDHKVAGIVSGAGGVRPGISMIQTERLTGGCNVALSGRVYALVDATQHPVAPGDLLTTSDTPGHAMKVTDPAKAPGAILGKAMGRLDSGRGLVLVLVSLQ